MNLQHQKILVQNADNLRFILDLLCTATDERNSTRTRLDAADDIVASHKLLKDPNIGTRSQTNSPPPTDGKP